MANERSDVAPRRWPRTVAIVAGSIVAGILLLAAVVVLLITQTDWGRERVRRYASEALNARANGTVTIGDASGNLLTGITLDDFTIVDSTGAPFVRAERISTKYSLRGLLSRRIVLSDVALVRPEIVLDRRPGEEWNFVRIFPTDTAAKAPGQTGFGSWILLEDVSVVDGHVRVRNAWSPPDSLAPAVRQARIDRALEGDSRLRIEAVPGGYQSVIDLRALHAWLPRLRLADPDSADILAQVDSLRTNADVFRPRTGEVRDLAGVFRFGDDSIRFADARLELPATELTGDGAYALADGALRVDVAAPRLAFADLLWLVPELPERGGGSFTAAVRRTASVGGGGAADAPGATSGSLTVDAPALDFRIDDSRIAGRLGVTMGDSVGIRDTDLRLTSVDTRLIESFAPDVELPRHGTVDGRVVLAGSPAALRLDANLAFVEPRSGRSSVRAVGEVGTGETVRLRDVRVSLDPVRMDLIRAFAPALPVGGTVTGDATLNGAYPGRMAVNGDLTLREPGSGRSRVLVDGGVTTGETVAFDGLALRFDPLQVALARTFAPDLPLGGTVHGRTVLNGPLDRIAASGDLVHTQDGERSHIVGTATIAGSAIAADLRLLPLSLVTAGRFAPAAGLRGTVSGAVQLRADAREVTAVGDLFAADSGSIRLDAWLDRRSLRYDVSALLGAFDAAGVTTHAPSTLLTGAVAAHGEGFDPATMTATLRAALSGPAVSLAADENGAASPVRADSIFLAADIADGLASVDSAHVRLASARLDARGTFGIVDQVEGALTYTLRVDSLSDFATYVPADTTPPMPPRPALQTAAAARARADSLRFARETEVRRMATGEPALRPLEVDTVRPLARDSLAGELRADGSIRGNVGGFAIDGTATLERVIAFGNSVRRGEIRYAAEQALTPAATYDVFAGFDSVYAAGFAFDTLTADVRYRGDFEAGDRGGTVDVRAVQDARRDYRVRADVVLALDRSLVRLDSLQLRFDTTLWASTRPSSFAWGAGVLEVDSLVLTNGEGGSIAADGRLEREGEAALDVALRDVQIGDVATLLQLDSSATGLLTLDARLRGRSDDPRLEARFALAAARLGDRPLPDVSGEAAYAGSRASAAAALTGTESGRTLLRAQGDVPVRLSLQPFAFERLDGPLDVTARADSLPLDALPSFSTAVQDVRGRVMGDFALRGTWDDPDLAGRVDLDLASFRVVPLGVSFTDIGGTVRLAGERATIDSLVAHSRGVVRLDGTVDVAALDSPVFDLRLIAQDAQLLDNERGRIRTDADITARGPIDRVDVAGTIGVESGVLYIPEPQKKLVALDDPAVAQVADTAAATTRELLPARNPLLDNLRVNVNVTVARDTWVRNTDANVEIYTPADEGALRVVLDQAAGSFGLEGRLNMDRGEYNAFGRRFVLTRGGVTFQGGPEIDPLLHIIARHQVQLPGREAMDINVHVGGSVSSPTLSLESDAQPPISQTDLLSYLAFGRSSTSLFQQQGSSLSGQSSGSGGLAGGVASLATRQLAGVALDAVVDEFESGAAREIGADVFRITPADLPAELSFGGFETVLLGTEVEVGKYFARRWFVAGQARPTFVRPGARVEYVTPRGFRWSISYEPRFLPRDPSFDTGQEDPRTRGVLGMFLRWERRY